jgi:hypothetical protein
MKIKIRDPKLECLCIISALVVVLIVASLRYGLDELPAWKVPNLYQDDALHWLAFFKTVSVGECLPYSSFIVSNLGAPFDGNWNDFPMSLPLMMLAGGFITKLFGFGVASNVILVFAHLVSAIAMYVCLRFSGSARIWALVFSICFGLSPFLFTRGFTHINITFAYSVPIAIIIGLLIYQKGSTFLRGWRLFVILAISFYFGGIFPYYTAFFLMIMAFAGLFCLLTEKRISSILPFILIAACTFANFFLLTEPFRQYARENGPNEFALSRFYSNLQICALRPVELFLPGSGSRIPILKQLSAFYENQDVFQNNFPYSESMTAYMGLPAILGLCLLCCMTGYLILTRRQKLISGWFWLISFFMAFAVVGGLNGFLGLGKFFLLRSSNRVSIYIVAASLFFLAILLTRWKKKMPLLLQICIALLMICLAVFEALPIGEPLRVHNEKTMKSDQELVFKLESILPNGAMIFNYPVIDFPESGNYSFLRPYLFTDKLRFSSGSNTGRSRETWQNEVASLSPTQMIDELKKLGFAGILVYAGDDLPNEQKQKSIQFLEATRNLPNLKIESHTGDFEFVRIHPDKSPQLPTIKPQFLSTWWPPEIYPEGLDLSMLAPSARWCAQKTGEVEVFNEQKTIMSVALSGKLLSANDARIEISARGTIFQTVDIKAGVPQFVSIDLPNALPGATRLKFQSTAMPIISDGRKFNFALLLDE